MNGYQSCRELKPELSFNLTLEVVSKISRVTPRVLLIRAKSTHCSHCREINLMHSDSWCGWRDTFCYSAMTKSLVHTLGFMFWLVER